MAWRHVRISMRQSLRGVVGNLAGPKTSISRSRNDTFALHRTTQWYGNVAIDMTLQRHPLVFAFTLCQSNSLFVLHDPLG